MLFESKKLKEDLDKLKSKRNGSLSNVPERTVDEYLDMANSCSSGDCTGLIPEGSPDPESEEGMAYNDIYSYNPSKMTTRSSTNDVK